MGKKILLADDSITIQKVIELTFSDEDFEVVTVGNGRLAIERLPEARPDVVLCDIIMPEKDGYEVCEFIKKHPTLSHTPVLLLTGAFEPFDQERAARVGCDGFLAKPFEPQTLIAKVKELLARAGSKPAPATPAPGAAPSPSPAPTTLSAPPPPPALADVEPEMDDFGPGAVFGAAPADIDDFEAREDIGTVRSPAYRATEDRGAAPPASMDELYDEPYSATDELLPLSDDEAESVAPPDPEAADEPAPWAQPTVEVPLEMRAQAGVESAQTAANGFEEVFEDEARAGGQPVVPAPAPSPAPAPVTPPAAPAPAAFESPVASFRDVAPAEEEAPTSITRSVAGEVQVPVDMVEKIAQRVVAQISEKVIREIAWEVIPDLAEALIKREIDRLKAELQQT